MTPTMVFSEDRTGEVFALAPLTRVDFPNCRSRVFLAYDEQGQGILENDILLRIVLGLLTGGKATGTWRLQRAWPEDLLREFEAVEPNHASD